MLGSEPRLYYKIHFQKHPLATLGYALGIRGKKDLSGLKKATLDDIGTKAFGVCVEAYTPGSRAQLASKNTRWRLWGMRWVCAG